VKHCQLAEDQFSARYEGQLSHDEAAQFERHLEACSACREAYAAFEAAVGRLRSLKLAATPLEYAAQVSAAVHSQPVQVASGAGFKARRLTLLLLSHAAAVLLGLSFVFFARKSPADDAPAVLLAQNDPPAPTIIRVPVEVPVEVRVEVPVEVIKEVLVERIEYVDRPVPNPLQRNFDSQQAFAADVAAALHESLRLARLAEERAALELRSRERPVETPAAKPRAVKSLANNVQSAPMVVVREDDHLRIRTRGEAEDVVPVLIATLDGPDRELAAAAEQHLSSIRSRLAEQDGLDVNAPLAPAAAAASSESGFRAWLRKQSSSTREQPAVELSTRERWQEWWNGRSLAQAESRAP
jgi:hypothetical protein